MSSAGKCECGEPLIYGDSHCTRCGKEVAYKFTPPTTASELQADGLLPQDVALKWLRDRGVRITFDCTSGDHSFYRFPSNDLYQLASALEAMPPQEAPATVRAADRCPHCENGKSKVISGGMGNICESVADCPFCDGTGTRRVASWKDERKVVGVVNLTEMAAFMRSFAPLHVIPFRQEPGDAMRATLCFVADELDKLAGCGVSVSELSSPPTRAQAASAGEPVAWRWIDTSDGTTGTWKDLQREPHPKEHGEGVHIEYAYTAPTDVAAYREVTLEDAFNGLAFYSICNGDVATTSDQAFLASLKHIHAVIRCPEGK